MQAMTSSKPSAQVLIERRKSRKQHRLRKSLFKSIWTIVLLICQLVSHITSFSWLPSMSINMRATTALRAVVPIFYDSSNHLHRDIKYHPEQPARIQSCVDKLEKYQQSAATISSSPSLELIDCATMTGDGSTHPHPHPPNNQPFTEQELNHARAMLVLTHSEPYVQTLEQRCRKSRQRRINENKPPLGFVGNVDDDTYLTTESYDVCLRATAAWIRAVNAALPPTSATAAMALARPPGHHATRDFANGFCLFNFAAAATLHALRSSSHRRVSVLDWDVHYGQGVADVLRGQSRARYASMHQSPAFPYLGSRRGEEGNVLTVPLSPGSTWSCGFRQALEEWVLPFVSAPGWKPDLVIVCAGYDALSSDELADCNLTAEDYGKMTKLIRDHVGDHVGLVFGLEGGYQLREGVAGGNLADAVLETIKAL